jgi:putative ABC transport system permease protein
MRLAHDARFALRLLRKSPAFTVVVLLTLGLCIGANTAIFSVLDAVLLRPAPYPDPGRLAMVITAWRQEGRQGMEESQTGALYEGVRDHATQLDVAAFSGDSGANFNWRGRSEFIRQQRVSAGFFRVLGVPPQIGREFTREEDVRGGPAVAVLSYGLWQRVFQGDSGAVGRSMNLRGEPYTVVGVMPRDFRSTSAVDVWTPLRPSRTGEGAGQNYGVVARVRPGATWASASDELKALSPGLLKVSGWHGASVIEQRIEPLQTGLTSEMRGELLITWAAVLVVLLIGCVNVAGLMLARSSARGREIATRMALGGGRGAIIRQLQMESLLLAVAGGIFGVGIGAAVLGWLKRLGAESFEGWRPIAIDGRVLAAMMGTAIFTSLLFGVLPALATSRLDIRSVLVEGGRGVSGGRKRWWRTGLVSCEVALSLVLLVSAGLLVRTLSYLNGLNPGFDPHNVLTAQVSLQDARYKTEADVNRLFAGTLERVRRIPGVQSAAVALTLPYERPLNDGFRLLDPPEPQGHPAEVVYSTPGYFDTMRIRLLAGRDFRDSDTPQAAKVAIVSESFAAKYFKGIEPVGRHLALETTPVEVVGVVGDVQQHSGLGPYGPVSVEPTLYIPVAQTSDGFLQVVHTWFSPRWVIRSAGAPGSVAAQVQAAVAAVDPLLPVAKFQTIADLQANITRDQRYHAALFSILACLALLLAAIGLYGLISQSVAQRTHEFGIRMALGATAGQTIGNAMKPGLLLSLAGVAAGYVLSLGAVRYLEHLVWGVRPNDPVTFVITAAVLLAVAAAASFAPALRILRLDPAKTLRAE